MKESQSSFERGDRVAWSEGMHERYGIVVAVIEPGTAPQDCLPPGFTPKRHFGLPRSRKSYLVQECSERGGEPTSTKVVWPDASKLEWDRVAQKLAGEF